MHFELVKSSHILSVVQGERNLTSNLMMPHKVKFLGLSSALVRLETTRERLLASLTDNFAAHSQYKATREKDDYSEQN